MRAWAGVGTRATRWEVHHDTNRSQAFPLSELPQRHRVHARPQAPLVTSFFAGAVHDVSLEDRAVTRTEAMGGVPGHIGLRPDGKHAYFVRPEGTTVEGVDTDSLRIVQTITVDTNPTTVAICH